MALCLVIALVHRKVLHGTCLGTQESIDSRHMAVSWMLNTLLHVLCLGLPQVKKCADAGADIVRITVQGKREAEACAKIRQRLFEDG